LSNNNNDNGGFVASCSDDYTINVWDPQSWLSVQIYKGHINYVTTLDQIDSDTIVSGSFDGTIHIWRISTGVNVIKINVGLNVIVYSVKSFLNGLKIACTTSYNLNVYTTNTGILDQALNDISSKSVELLSDRFFASGGDQMRVIVWDSNTYKSIHNLIGHKNPIYCIKKLSSSQMASADDGGTINIWNWLNGTLVFKLKGHTKGLYFSSLDLFDANTLISGALDQTILLWNISSGVLVQAINVNLEVYALTMLKKCNNF
jgi:WD40 repeat protein